MEMFISILSILSFVFMNFGVGYMMVGGIYNAVDSNDNRMLITIVLSAMMVLSYCTSAIVAFYGYNHINDVIAENKKQRHKIHRE